MGLRGRTREVSRTGVRMLSAGGRGLAPGAGVFTAAVSVVSAFGASGTARTPTAVPATPVTFLTPRISRTRRDPGFHGRGTRTTSRSLSGGRDGFTASAGARARCPGTAGFLRPILVVSRRVAESAGAAESAGLCRRPCRLSSCGCGRMDNTATGVESGRRRRLTSRVPRRCLGSSFCANVTVAFTLSSTTTV
jgi:hypothetical protein